MPVNRHTFRVIYGDTDAMGIVYYANYLRYFEAGRSELMRAFGLPYQELEALGYALPVAEAHVKYRAPARYDDQLTLETRVARIRAVSLQIEYKLERDADGVVIATGQTMHACLGPSGELERFPDVVMARFGVD